MGYPFRQAAALITAVAALLPMGVAASAAASPSLKVTTLGRDGAVVATTVTLVHMSSHAQYRVASGTAKVLPSGRYAALVDIWNSRDSTDTVAATIVSVTAPKAITIDARAGVSLKVRLDDNPDAAFTQQLSGQVCVNGTGMGAGGWNRPGSFFVIPNTSSELRFAYMSTWRRWDDSEAYVVNGEAVGLPRYGIMKFRSSLATVTAQVRKGPSGAAYNTLAVQPEQSNGVGCADSLYTGLVNAAPPYTVKAHITPGTWLVRSESGIDFWWDRRTFTTGQQVTDVFNRAAWGPAQIVPAIAGKNVIFSGERMFTDWYQLGAQASVKTVSTLSLNGTTVATRTSTSWGDDNPQQSFPVATAGWYTLTSTATRYNPNVTYPADLLSPKATTSFRFYAKPGMSTIAPVLLTRFRPDGLDMSNRAAPSSTTAIPLFFDRQRWLSDLAYPTATAKTVTAWASSDDGATWQAVPVTNSSGKWSISVTNPASGYVSLRAQVADGAGNIGTTTIHRAYAIG
ncbi:hypothetical protein F4553_003492 [Allocatelliglobosispora scoriae]|uniref:Uncharacterized protein n=1 Tax=Allocatelliglobosispora scoriae TaxID=643052 RepID=A0A841BT65_9ACTN|nr:hypothetical protein [Allocatelliglobosispora scoriae]MBB5870113.1 hypothetical protein [Allocatelliglobosispora scoriae]